MKPLTEDAARSAKHATNLSILLKRESQNLLILETRTQKGSERGQAAKQKRAQEVVALEARRRRQLGAKRARIR